MSTSRGARPPPPAGIGLLQRGLQHRRKRPGQKPTEHVHPGRVQRDGSMTDMTKIHASYTATGRTLCGRVRAGLTIVTPGEFLALVANFPTTGQGCQTCARAAVAFPARRAPQSPASAGGHPGHPVPISRRRIALRAAQTPPRRSRAPRTWPGSAPRGKPPRPPPGPPRWSPREPRRAGRIPVGHHAGKFRDGIEFRRGHGPGKNRRENQEWPGCLLP